VISVVLVSNVGGFERPGFFLILSNNMLVSTITWYPFEFATQLLCFRLNKDVDKYLE
jgi:hypothetical protein